MFIRLSCRDHGFCIEIRPSRAYGQKRAFRAEQKEHGSVCFRVLFCHDLAPRLPKVRTGDCAQICLRWGILTRHPAGATLPRPTHSGVSTCSHHALRGRGQPALGRDFRNRLFFATDGMLDKNSNKAKTKSPSVVESKSVSSPSLVREGGPRQRWVSSLCDAQNGDAQTL